MKVELLTRDHGFVTRGEIPPFQPPPEVVTWGTRVFVRDDTLNVEDHEVIVYREGLLYHLDAALDPSKRRN